MSLALDQARLAASLGETPIGAVLVWEGQVTASAYNRRELDRLATAHAELLAINEACRKLGGWRLHKATLYVTLEPCPMCAGAIINARVARVFYGARDAAMGACGGVLNLFMEAFPHRPQLVGGICGQESRALLSAFFAAMREK